MLRLKLRVLRRGDASTHSKGLQFLLGLLKAASAVTGALSRGPEQVPEQAAARPSSGPGMAAHSLPRCLGK